MTAPAAPALVRWDVKVMLEAPQGFSWRPFIEVFHRWIQDGRPGGILVDVAEYTHVSPGPQVLLIAHEGHWVLDTAGWGPGLLYSQRRPPENSGDPLRRALRECLVACRLLESEPEAQKLRFRADRIEVTANDRLLAPQAPSTYKWLEPALRALLVPLFGGAGLEFIRETEPRRRAGVRVQAAAQPSIADLLSRL